MSAAYSFLYVFPCSVCIRPELTGRLFRSATGRMRRKPKRHEQAASRRRGYRGFVPSRRVCYIDADAVIGRAKTISLVTCKLASETVVRVYRRSYAQVRKVKRSALPASKPPSCPRFRDDGTGVRARLASGTLPCTLDARISHHCLHCHRMQGYLAGPHRHGDIPGTHCAELNDRAVWLRLRLVDGAERGHLSL